MEPEGLAAALDQLKEHGFFDPYHVTTFRAFRPEKGGGGQREVVIEIADDGPASPHRYRVVAFDEYGRKAAGGPADSVDGALARTRWSDLDRPRKDDTDPEEIV